MREGKIMATGSKRGSSADAALRWKKIMKAVGWANKCKSLVVYLYAFQRYCRLCAPAHHFFPPHLYSLPKNVPMFPWD